MRSWAMLYFLLHATINIYCYSKSFFFVSAEELAQEKQKLYDAIGYQEDGPGTVYPKEVRVHVTPFAGSVDKTPSRPWVCEV